MKHTATLTVRSYELDAYNHVNNAHYLHYLEYARIDFLRAVNFDYEGMMAAGFFLYVTRVDIQYKAPAKLFDQLSIEVEPLKLGKVSGTFRQRIINQRGELCAEADVSWGCVDANGKPSRFPPQFDIKGLIPE